MFFDCFMLQKNQLLVALCCTTSCLIIQALPTAPGFFDSMHLALLFHTMKGFWVSKNDHGIPEILWRSLESCEV